VQGDLDRVAATWVTTLKSWASSHPAGGGGSHGSSGLEHNDDEKQKALLAKQKHKQDVSKTKKRQYCEENGHQEIPNTGVCKNCGEMV
jgi:ribosomal protein L32